MNKEAIRLLDRLYKDLYLSYEVLHHSSGNKYDKFNNIKEYIDKLEDIHTRVSESKRHINYLKKLYYDKYVIKTEDIPESYYEHQKEVALERGYGHAEITADQKNQIQEEVINNQKSRLDVWIDYFLSEDANVYPFWAKYWAFQGMLKLGTYDKEKGEFHKRTRNTVEPFADLNREALAMSIDMMIKMLNKEEIDDKELEILVKTGSFQKIYSYILTKVLKDNKNITKRNIGKWIKYDRGSDHMPLVESLKGYNTGWCTAGESTAKSQLQGGDFYVYYTLDENDEYKVPRIAIRMEYNQIAEIRGIAQNQNIESEIEEVVEEKLKEFPDRDKYYKKVNDMKKLTSIYKKHKNKEELSKEELRFLYEIDVEIIGFGYGKDPRINEILDERCNKRDDIANIFNCNEDQVAFSKYEINGETVYLFGGLYLDVILSEKLNKKLPKFIRRNLDLSGLTSAEGLIFPSSIGGGLDLSNLTSAEGLVLPTNIGGNLDLVALRSAKGMNLPSRIGGSLYLNSLTSAEGLVLPTSIGGNLNLNGLTSAKDLKFPPSIGDSLFLNNLIIAEGLALPTSIGGDLCLDELISAKGLKLPQSIGGSLYLRGLTSAEGLKLPPNIGGSLNLKSLTSAEDLVLPTSIGGNLNLNGLTSAKDLKLPQSIGDSLFLNNLIIAEGLALPTSIGGDLCLDGLINAEGLVLPESIGGSLYLGSLTSAKGLNLPSTIIYGLHLKNLTSIEGMIIPNPLTYKIYMCGFEINPQNVHLYRNNKTK